MICQDTGIRARDQKNMMTRYTWSKWQNAGQQTGVHG